MMGRLLLLLLLAFAKTAPAQSDYIVGTEALQSEEFTSAVSHLQEAVSTQPSAAAYYNLALAFAKTNQSASASWSFISSQQLGGTGDYDSAARIIYSSLPADLVPLKPDGATQLIRRQALRVPNFFALMIAGLACILFAGMLGLQTGGLAGFGVSRYVLLILSGVLAGLVLAIQQSVVEVDQAAIIQNSQLHVGATPESEGIRTIPIGAVVEFGEYLNGMYAVRLPNNESGWMQATHLRKALAPFE